MSSKLFTNATIISFDDAYESIKTLSNHDLLVKGDVISEIANSITPPIHAEVVDCKGMILSPGFINTHSHLWQTVMRTLAPDTNLAEYFVSYSQFSPIPGSLSPSDVYLSTLAGYYEGFASGTTAFVEHGHSNWSVEALESGYDAACDSGARVMYCAAFEDRENVTAEEGYKALVKRVSEKKSNRVQLGLAWDNLGVADATEIAAKKSMIASAPLHALTVHHLGAPWPTPDSGPLTVAKHKLAADLIPDLPIIISHAGLITPAEITAVRENDMFISITPESEYHFGHGQKASPSVLDHACLGVDTHFAFSGDVLGQARLFLQTVRDREFNRVLENGKVPRGNPMSVGDAFLLLTRQGARALKREGEIGVLKVGAKADIAVFDGTAPAMSGWTNAIAAVILHASVGDIKHVLVGGEWRKRDGELVLPGVKGGWKGFEKKFAEIARRVQRENPRPQATGERLFGVADFEDVEVRAIKACGSG